MYSAHVIVASFKPFDLFVSDVSDLYYWIDVSFSDHVLSNFFSNSVYTIRADDDLLLTIYVTAYGMNNKIKTFILGSRSIFLRHIFNST